MLLMVAMVSLTEQRGLTHAQRKTSMEMVLPLGKTVMMGMLLFSEVPMGRLSPVRVSIVHRFWQMVIQMAMVSIGLSLMGTVLLKPTAT